MKDNSRLHIMYRHGEQRVLQLISTIKNKRWIDKKALTTASIASVRSENERAVKLLKTSDNRGFENSICKCVR